MSAIRVGVSGVVRVLNMCLCTTMVTACAVQASFKCGD